MPSSNPSSIKPSRLNALLCALGALSFLGFADAAYLTAKHYVALPLPCSLTRGCETVLTSQYATLGGIPIALLGALYYLGMLGLVLLFFSTSRNGIFARMMIVLAGIATAAYAVLVYLQAAVIHAFCLYCLTSAAITVLLLAGSIILLSFAKRRENAAVV